MLDPRVAVDAVRHQAELLIMDHIEFDRDPPANLTTLVLAFTASDGVWHNAQPTSANRCLPRAIENDEAPVKLVTGAGGARKRWKLEKFSMAPI